MGVGVTRGLVPVLAVTGTGRSPSSRSDRSPSRGAAGGVPSEGKEAPVSNEIEALPDRVTPFVSVNPAMRWGQPCVNGTRLPVDAVAGMVWAEGVDVAADQYDLTRADVLVACWYAGTYGLPGRRESLFPVRQWPKRWGAWADSVAGALWKVTEVDYDAVPDPPRAALPEVPERGVPDGGAMAP